MLIKTSKQDYYIALLIVSGNVYIYIYIYTVSKPIKITYKTIAQIKQG